jgi:hypothetical protein
MLRLTEKERRELFIGEGEKRGTFLRWRKRSK